jgi:UDP-glucose 4-epimerase
LDFTKKKSDFFNLGTNKGFTVFEIIKEAEKVTGKKILVEEKDRRSGDAPSLVASNKKAEEILKWVPEKNLHDIIQSAWQWQENKKY